MTGWFYGCFKAKMLNYGLENMNGVSSVYGRWSMGWEMNAEMMDIIYHVVPGAGSRLVDETDWTWPTSGATCTEPRFEATYLLKVK